MMRLKLKFVVEEVINKDNVIIKAKTSGILKRSKGINVPYVKIGGAFND